MALSPSLIFSTDEHALFAGDPVDGFIRRTENLNGKPALFFSADEIEILEASFSNGLVLKFLLEVPSLIAIRAWMNTGTISPHSHCGFLDASSVLLALGSLEDYARLFSHTYVTVEGCHARLVKWVPQWNNLLDPPFAPVWVTLPNLRPHFFHRQVLFSIAASLGTPLRMHTTTANRNDMLYGRILVEMNVTSDHPDAIWLGSRLTGYWQTILVEDVPPYCANCNIFGHTTWECPLLENSPSADGSFPPVPWPEAGPEPLEDNSLVIEEVRPVVRSPSAPAAPSPTFSPPPRGLRVRQRLRGLRPPIRS